MLSSFETKFCCRCIAIAVMCVQKGAYFFLAILHSEWAPWNCPQSVQKNWWREKRWKCAILYNFMMYSFKANVVKWHLSTGGKFSSWDSDSSFERRCSLKEQSHLIKIPCWWLSAEGRSEYRSLLCKLTKWWNLAKLFHMTCCYKMLDTKLRIFRNCRKIITPFNGTQWGSALTTRADTVLPHLQNIFSQPPTCLSSFLQAVGGGMPGYQLPPPQSL